MTNVKLMGNEIGERIKAVRTRAGMNLVEFGKALDVSYVAVSNWERGVNGPSRDNLQAISRLYGVSYGWLMGEESNAGESVPAPESASFAEPALPAIHSDAELVHTKDVPKHLSLQSSEEVWRVSGRSLEGVGVFPGDFVIVNLKLQARAGDAVLAIMHDGKSRALLRMYTPPALISGSRTPTGPILVDDNRVIVKGPITTILRHR